MKVSNNDGQVRDKLPISPHGGVIRLRGRHDPSSACLVC